MRRTAFLFLVVLPFVFAVGCASTDWEARYLEKEQEARALQDEYSTMNQALAESEAVNEEMKGELDQRDARIDTLNRTTVAEKAQPAATPVDDHAAQLQLELARLQKKYGDLVKLTPEGNIEITLQSAVTFSSGSYELTKAGKKTLDGVARELNGEFAGNMVRVIGHTDTDPIKKSPFKDNWELASERSLEVIRYLSGTHGIEPSRLVGASRGETAPVESNATKEGRIRNRRVEIVVVIPRKQIVGEYTSQR